MIHVPMRATRFLPLHVLMPDTSGMGIHEHMVT
jgi:hypothetical protein